MVEHDGFPIRIRFIDIPHRDERTGPVREDSQGERVMRERVLRERESYERESFEREYELGRKLDEKLSAFYREKNLRCGGLLLFLLTSIAL